MCKALLFAITDAILHPADPYLRLRCSFPSSRSVGWHRCVTPGGLPWAEGSCCTHCSAPCCWSSRHPLTDGGGPAGPHLHQDNSEGCSHLQSPLWDYCTQFNLTPSRLLPCSLSSINPWSITNKLLPINFHFRALTRGPNQRHLVIKMAIRSKL